MWHPATQQISVFSIRGTALSSFAVMQPYFFPYESYFDLIGSVDRFVLFDNAQFPRRGRVHRCEVKRRNGGHKWLTLSLKKADQKTEIRLMKFADGAGVKLNYDFDSASIPSVLFGVSRSEFLPAEELLVDFLERIILLLSKTRGIETPILRSSHILDRGGLPYEQYIIALGKKIASNTYVNPPGGRSLYTYSTFAENNMTLEFQTPTQKPEKSLLDTLL